MTLLVALALGVSPTDFEALIDPAWKQVKPASAAKPGVSWDYRVTPPFPSEWPMTPKSTLVRWVYAGGIDQQISDGQRVAGPWARIDIAPDGKTKLTTLSKTLEGNDIQGIKPVSEAQADLLRRAFDTGDAVRSGELAPIKGAWCVWLRYNGLIAARLKPKHEAFFAALACDAK